MGVKKIEFSGLEFSKLFPFYIQLSTDYKIEEIGKSLPILLPTLEINSLFFDNFYIDRPLIEANEKNIIDKIQGQLIVIRNKFDKELILKGQFEKISSINKYVFFGSPWFQNTDQLIEKNITINDFAIHDSTIDLLHILKNNVISNGELKEIVAKIKNQNIILERSQNSLKLREKILNILSESTDILLSNENIYDAIKKSISSIGDAINLDLISISQNILKKPNDTSSTIQIEWNTIIDIDDFSFNELNSIILDENEIIFNDLKNQLPFEIDTNLLNKQSKLFDFCSRFNIKSSLILPIYIRNTFWGTIGFFECKNERSWSITEYSLLKSFTNSISSAIDRQNTSNELFSMAQFPLESPYPVIRIDLKGQLILRNQASNKLKQLTINNKKKSDIVLFKYLSKILNKDNRELIFEGFNENEYYQITARLSANNLNINIYITNITKEKKSEKKLEKALLDSQQASIAKEAFLANMSHEIRTPLNGIIGMIRELDKEELSVKQQYYVDSSKKASNHLLSIINNILDLSKIEAGEFNLEKNNFSLHNIVTDVKKILENQSAEKGIAFETEIDKNISKAFIGDESRIRQVLINIVGNSIKFTSVGSIKIICSAIHTYSKLQEIKIKIIDTGIGMDDIYLNQLFTKFHQEDATSSRKHEGTGLGMVITRELIELMNGYIIVSSKKNVGTEVEISLTLAIGDENKIEKNEDNFKLNSLKNKKILLVEDNEMNRFVALNALLPYNMVVTEAENGAIALKILETQKFDLILMDLQMPIMGGIEATRIIRNELKINTPIIALTANAFKSEIEKCISEGMNNYVTKPFEKKDLLNIIFKEIGIKKKFELPKKVEKPKITAFKKPYYDLKKLKEISPNDDAFILKMTKLFSEIIPKYIEEMEIALKNKDLEAVSKVAHKLKPSLFNMNIHILKEDVKTIEFCLIEKTEYEDLKQICDHFIQILKEIINSIKKNELK